MTTWSSPPPGVYPWVVMSTLSALVSPARAKVS
jgi:hypothetical protein